MSRPALVIHGGCGVMAKLDMSEADWATARADLARSLRAGWTILAKGGSALDAVEACVVVMEDSPVFNAGHGAALNSAGQHELEASIMDGATLEAGGVTMARHIRNPVKAARKIMEKGDAVILGGAFADRFAEQSGLDMVEHAYFTTERRVKALAKLKQSGDDGRPFKPTEADKHGTVGAAALDAEGNLAAATSTGGYNNKPEGRIGDTPIVGAGTYAKNGVCAVSGTGKGEFFIRYAVGHEITARVGYLGEPIATAAEHVVKQDLAKHSIGAGVIVVDAHGNIAAPYNTDGMFRGWVTQDGDMSVATHDEVFFLERLAIA